MEDNKDIAIDYIKAQMVKVQEMYDELLDKYKDEIEKRTVAETNFKALYANCVQNGWITPPTQEHKDNCDCEECKDKSNDQK